MSTQQKYTPSDKWKVTAVASSIGFVIASGILLNKFRARQHDNIPMIATDECSFIIGHLSVFTQKSRIFNEWLYNAIKKEGFPSVCCMTRLPSVKYALITNPVHVKCIFETEFDSAQKSQKQRIWFEELLGDGIFSVVCYHTPFSAHTPASYCFYANDRTEKNGVFIEKSLRECFQCAI